MDTWKDKDGEELITRLCDIKINIDILEILVDSGVNIHTRSKVCLYMDYSYIVYICYNIVYIWVFYYCLFICILYGLFIIVYLYVYYMGCLLLFIYVYIIWVIYYCLFSIDA
eukprot:GHVR01064663.1.p1 GENE.GHVR01064663.1~~GHVR01064663.1.p1  ORF type:complete len:112 (+),score=8.76 GHVR01064663.1:148-483(+)